MAKTEADIAAKKEKKEKKRKLEEVEDGEPTPKKSKKDKKRKSEAADDMEIDGQELVKVEPAKQEEKDEKALIAIPLAALVPFANPLAAEKDQKKVLKSVKKGKLLTSPYPWSRLQCRKTTSSKAPSANTFRSRKIQIP